MVERLLTCAALAVERRGASVQFGPIGQAGARAPLEEGVKERVGAKLLGANGCQEQAALVERAQPHGRVLLAEHMVANERVELGQDRRSQQKRLNVRRLAS